MGVKNARSIASAKYPEAQCGLSDYGAGKHIKGPVNFAEKGTFANLLAHIFEAHHAF